MTRSLRPVPKHPGSNQPLRRILSCIRPRPAFSRVRSHSEAGQSTTEYTLVILVAATIALLLLNWAKDGAIVALFQTIFDKVVAMFS